MNIPLLPIPLSHFPAQGYTNFLINLVPLFAYPIGAVPFVAAADLIFGLTTLQLQLHHCHNTSAAGIPHFASGIWLAIHMCIAWQAKFGPVTS